MINPVGYLRVIREMVSQTATTTLQRDPDDPYDPDDDLPFTITEVTDASIHD